MTFVEFFGEVVFFQGLGSGFWRGPTSL
jgi:hypothetical protein